jgi:hypothetical protein
MELERRAQSSSKLSMKASLDSLQASMSLTSWLVPLPAVPMVACAANTVRSLTVAIMPRPTLPTLEQYYNAKPMRLS